MKSLDLRKIPTKLINLDSQKERLDLCTTRLNNLGINFDRFSAIPHEVGIIGCGKSHLEVLSNIEPDTLVLEDDVVPTEWFKPVLEIPDEADAVYLGLSRWGYHQSTWPLSAPYILTEYYSDTYARIFNMCGGHAILYRKQPYIDAVVREIKYCLEKDIPLDVGMAKLHTKFTILATKNPFFYQEGIRADTDIKLIFNEDISRQSL